jgi:hypothetical protein
VICAFGIDECRDGPEIKIYCLSTYWFLQQQYNKCWHLIVSLWNIQGRRQGKSRGGAVGKRIPRLPEYSTAGRGQSVLLAEKRGWCWERTECAAGREERMMLGEDSGCCRERTEDATERGQRMLLGGTEVVTGREKRMLLGEDRGGSLERPENAVGRVQRCYWNRIYWKGTEDAAGRGQICYWKKSEDGPGEDIRYCERTESAARKGQRLQQREDTVSA